MLVLSGWHRRVLKMGSVEKLSQFKKLQIQVRGGNEASMEEVCHWGHAVKSTARPSSGSALCANIRALSPATWFLCDALTMPWVSRQWDCPPCNENPEGEPREVFSCSLRQFVTAMKGWPPQPRILLCPLASGSAGIPWLEQAPFQSLLFPHFLSYRQHQPRWISGCPHPVWPYLIW